MFNLIAHRGLVNNTQDNSLESLTNGLKSDKYKGIETDVRETLDNEFILYHNPLFKGNLVKNTSYKSFKKENIIKLSDLLKIKTNKILLLEIKDFNINI
ncbi:MAG: glycerophosphodiester phosphodiesterase family protein, partial [Bacilli bacterium]